MEEIFVFIICLVGSAIQGATGFGYAILTMAVRPFIIPFKTVSSVVLVLAFIMTGQMAIRMRKYVKFKLIIPPTLASLVGRTIGVY